MCQFCYTSCDQCVNFNALTCFQKKEISSTNENDTLKDILLSDNLLDSIMNEQSSNIKTEMEGK